MNLNKSLYDGINTINKKIDNKKRKQAFHSDDEPTIGPNIGFISQDENKHLTKIEFLSKRGKPRKTGFCFCGATLALWDCGFGKKKVCRKTGKPMSNCKNYK